VSGPMACRGPKPDRRRALKYLHPIYALVIASLMVPAVALALMAGRALAAEMPKEFQGNSFQRPWCSTDILKELKDDLDAARDIRTVSNGEPSDCEDKRDSVEITATGVRSPTVSCVVRKVTKFDVCPWGMIFRNRERARVLRPFQINPWSPGHHIVLQCTAGGSKRSETIGTDWVIEKGSILVGVPRDYRCRWDRRGARR
jgi:hypothetical protein